MNYTNIMYVRKLDDDNSEITSVISRIIAFAREFGIPIYDYANSSNITSKSLFVSVGGDGTMLYTLRQSAIYGAHAIGINLGSVGFLADTIPKNTYQFLHDCFFSSDMIHDKRSLLMLDNYTGLVEKPAMNEYLIHGKDFSTFFKCEVYVDDKHIVSLSGSGVNISTPTGSTAYSVGMGGNIIMPSVDVFMIVPVIPYTLSARPVIVDASSVIKIKTTLTNRSPQATVLADGRPTTVCNRESEDSEKEFIFSRYRNKATIIHSRDWNFFDILSKKMDWKN